MPVNHVVLASGAVVAVSVAVAAALAMYENPDLRRYAEDIRRRIVVAFSSIGDGINQPNRAPRYNRPEDADGFLQTRQGQNADPGVDADDETRRRQREELLYWNSMLLKKKEEEAAKTQTGSISESQSARPRGATRGSSFDDFLRPDENAEQGTFVFNTGTDAQAGNSGLRHRGVPTAIAAGVSPLYANPFADEYHIDNDEVAEMSATYVPPRPPKKDDGMSDIYSATTRDQDDIRSRTVDASPSPALIDIVSNASLVQEFSTPSVIERQLGEEEFMSAGQDDRQDAYASIQAWAQDSSRNFYSPLPVTPAAPVSEPELVSEGQLTPTDSVSIIGSGEDVANDAMSSQAGEHGRPYDVLSESEGMLTPASWSEVGSVVSDNEANAHANTPLRG